MKHLLIITALSASIACSAQFNKGTDTLDGQRVLSFAQQMPVFNGDMMKYIDSTFKYPMTENFTGTVYATCIIDTAGYVQRVTITNPEKPGRLTDIEKEVLRIVRLMPRWQPGRQQGKAVPIRYDIPVHVSTE